MLKTAKLSKVFQDEATHTVYYLINISPLGPLNFEVLEKAQTRKDVSYSHLRVFRCKNFVHVPKEQRSKLDDNAVSHVFVGYSDKEFGFKLWDPTKKKLVKSRDMVFQEDQTLGDFGKANQSKGKNDDFIELVPILLSLEQPRNEKEEIDELLRDNSASDILAQELVEHEEQGEQEDLIPQARRSTREYYPYTRYPSSEYMLVIDEGEPQSFHEAMQDKMDSLQKNENYELVQLPKGRKSLENKWAFKWLRDMFEKNTTKLKKIHINKNASNMLKKVVLKQKLQLCIETTGLNSM